MSPMEIFTRPTVKLALHEIVEDSLARGALPIQNHIEYVMQHLPVEDYEAALRRTLGSYINDCNRQPSRNAARAVVSALEAAADPAKAEHASKRVAAIGDLWTKMLARQIRIGDNEYRVLGDATAAEVAMFAKSLNDLATRTAQNAAAYRKLSKQMQSFGAARVRDLPVDVGQSFMTELAA